MCEHLFLWGLRWKVMKELSHALQWYHGLVGPLVVAPLCSRRRTLTQTWWQRNGLHSHVFLMLRDGPVLLSKGRSTGLYGHVAWWWGMALCSSPRVVLLGSMAMCSWWWGMALCSSPRVVPLTGPQQTNPVMDMVVNLGPADKSILLLVYHPHWPPAT